MHSGIMDVAMFDEVMTVKLEPLENPESLNELCRLCAKTSSFMIPILKGDLQHNLYDKINHYLPICVTEDDKLPLQVCDNCATTILTFHDLQQGCLDAQTKLLHLLEILDIIKKDAIKKNAIKKPILIDQGTSIDSNEILDLIEEMKTETPEWSESETLDDCQINIKENEGYISQADSNALFVDKSTQVDFKRLDTKSKRDTKKKVLSETDRLHICEICGKTFRLRQYLNRHLKIHTDIFPLKCNLCDKGFHKQYLLQAHINTHTGTKPFVCNYCNRAFRLKRALKHHIFIHSGEKPYTCNYCGRKFSRNSTMNRHKRSHSNQRPYACKHCGQTFRQYTTMHLHTRIHSGEKPYICNVCNTSFSRLDTLKKHRITHTDEKPYQCKICDQSFRIRRTLKRHELTHPEYVDEPKNCPKNILF